MIAANEKYYYKDLLSSEARSKIYDLLADLYNRLPGQEFVDRAKANLSELSPYPAPGSRPARAWRQAFLKQLERLKSSLKALDQPEKLLELSVERTRLIRGVGAVTGLLPPYESVYRGEGMIMGESTRQVLGFYQEAGYSLPEGWTDPPDYIGIEMDFMACLCRQEAGAWQRGETETARAKKVRQGEFLANHLMQWASDFSEQYLSHTTNGFLTAVLEATHCFLELEGREFFSSEAPDKANGSEPV